MLSTQWRGFIFAANHYSPNNPANVHREAASPAAMAGVVLTVL